MSNHPTVDNFSSQSSPTILFTCTTFLSKKEKFEELQKALTTFIEHNKDDLYLITDFLVINEFANDIENQQNDIYYLEQLKIQFPFIEFINKTHDQRGQANSLNMILSRLEKFKYWLHWEESWFTIRPFLKESVDILESKYYLDQLQVNNGWRDVGKWMLDRGDFIEIFPDAKQKWGRIRSSKNNSHINWVKTPWPFKGSWPLWSLQPSFDRISTLSKMKDYYFDTSSKKWPLQFEYEFACRWFMLGARKGILLTPAAIRKKNHVSTYKS
jgi:hypothetical protein